MNKHQSNDVFWRHKFKHSWQHTTLTLTSGHNEFQWHFKPSHSLISWQYRIKKTTQFRLLCVHNWQENPFLIIRTFFRFVTACSEVDFNLVLQCKRFSRFFHDRFKHISNPPYCNLANYGIQQISGVPFFTSEVFQILKRCFCPI